jgi:hypothetical protein
MSRYLSLLSFVLLSVASTVLAGSSCVAFDISWNLLAFGFNGKDYNAGTQDSWGSGTPTDITAQGRPPFNGVNTTCYLSQFTNAIYIRGADSTNPSDIHIYDAAANSWSTQKVTVPNNLNLNSLDAILDHDTNVFYGYADGELFSLDMSLLKAADSSALPWKDVQDAGLNAPSYQPVMALAQNHIHFLGVPGLPDGSAKIFVIHFSFMQPEPQSYGSFPNTHGQATSFFQDSGVQQEFAFIPDDGSATYVINVETNTTQTLKGPTTQDSGATYFASTSALVQLTSSGEVSFLPYNAGSTSVNSAATWSTVSKLPKALAASSSSSAPPSGSSATGSTAKSITGSATGTTSGTAQGGVATGGADTSGALTLQTASWALTGALALTVSALSLF